MINNTLISGAVISREVVYTKLDGTRMYQVILETKRSSGIADYIPCYIGEWVLLEDVQEGDRIKIRGQLRTYNLEGHLKIVIYAVNVAKDYDEEDLNYVQVEGVICKPVINRQTPKAREIADMMIASQRNRIKSSYIPCIVWGRNALYASRLSVGTKVYVEGRFQSRIYTKVLEDGETEDRTAYELSLQWLETLEDE